ncbi:hypothetical protein J4732_09070 [Serratia marcescens]|uniref:Uncharacterized protein n=1 Tax=Serratia marcescens TaxID=615 RepID=A0A939NQB3_SERMA|nr:hypothetical protein [Serratia marcescens]
MAIDCNARPAAVPKAGSRRSGTRAQLLFQLCGDLLIAGGVSGRCLDNSIIIKPRHADGGAMKAEAVRFIVLPCGFKLASWCRAQMTIALRGGGEQMNYLDSPRAWRRRRAMLAPLLTDSGRYHAATAERP